MASVNVYSYASNVTTSAYTLLFTTTVPCSSLEITDTSTKLLKLATGLSGSQIDICSVPVSGTVVVPVGFLRAGTPIWIKAIDATASAGFNVVSLLG